MYIYLVLYQIYIYSSVGGAREGAHGLTGAEGDGARAAEVLQAAHGGGVLRLPADAAAALEITSGSARPKAYSLFFIYRYILHI